ncbi:MAG: squalene/phytoene synthase family protein, partial [Elusimicrobiota bacterium]
MLNESWEFSKKILPKVSRTFALNINKLKGDTHRAVLCGYLIFRMADCLEDSVFQSEKEKIDNLLSFARIFRKREPLSDSVKSFKAFKNIWKEESPEMELMEKGEKVLEVYHSLPQPYSEAIAKNISETAVGMAEFQKKKLISDKSTYQMKNMEELSLYCYYVAGVVGKMLTDIFCLNEDIAPFKNQLNAYDRSFGEGLQLTNIAKDWKKDLKRGWMYVPKNVYDIYSETESDEIKIRKFLSFKAFEGLRGAFLYVKNIPESSVSIRLFCVIPLVIASATLISICRSEGNKISREQVNAIMSESKSLASDNDMLESAFNAFSYEMK